MVNVHRSNDHLDGISRIDPMNDVNFIEELVNIFFSWKMVSNKIQIMNILQQ